jgi:hypothetical protein
MFWDSYTIEPITPSCELYERVLTQAFWKSVEVQSLVWRNCEFGDVAHNAFPAASPFSKDGRLVMHGLYLDAAPPKPWDQLLLWLRKQCMGLKPLEG